METKKKHQISKKDISNLCNEVNKFDREFGINLSSINPDGEPELVFEQFMTSFQDFLYGVTCEINGIPSEKYSTKKERIREFGMKEFSELSDLELNSTNTYDANSLKFKYRFITSYLIMYIENIEKIALHKYEHLSRFKTGKYENAYFYLKNLTDDTRRFIKVVLSGNPYGNIMLKMNQNCNYIRTKKVDPTLLNKNIRTLRHDLKEGLKYSLFTEKEMPDDIAIHYILQLAYLLCTGDTSLDVLPNFKDIQGADTSYELRGLTEALGCAIIENREYKKRPILYLAFNKARPKIMSKYKDINENWFISTGVRALEYTKFFCNDKYISKFINKMI